MGTHPIFESDFDCLTEKMDRLLLPTSAGIITSIAAAKIWSKGYKDIGVILGLGSAVIGYFCIFDFRRSRDPEYKSKLVEARKKEFELLSHRPIVDLLDSVVQRHGSIKVLKDPRSNQQLMMQYVQRGEMAMNSDKMEGVKYFAIAAGIQYIGAGEGKAQQLIDTVCSMIPALADSIVDNFKKDKKAVDDFIKKEESKQTSSLQSRDDFFKNLQKSSPKIEEIEETELVEDPIDESDEEPIKETKPKSPEVKPEIEPEVEPEVEPEIEEKPEVEETKETESPQTEVLSTPPPVQQSEVQEESQEMVSSPEIITSEEARDASCLTPEPEDKPEAESVIVREIVGDAPQIKKIVVNESEEMVDEELE